MTATLSDQGRLQRQEVHYRGAFCWLETIFKKSPGRISNGGDEIELFSGKFEFLSRMTASNKCANDTDSAVVRNCKRETFDC